MILHVRLFHPRRVHIIRFGPINALQELVSTGIPAIELISQGIFLVIILMIIFSLIKFLKLDDLGYDGLIKDT